MFIAPISTFRQFKIVRIVCLCLMTLMILVAATGCNEVTRQVKASPAPDSGFIADASKMTEQRDRYPFNRVWVSPEYQKSRDTYKKVIIAPVVTKHLRQMDWC